MHDIKEIRKDPQRFKSGLMRLGIDYDLDYLLSLDEERRENIQKVQKLKELRNKYSKEVGVLKKEGKDAAEIIEKVKKINKEIPELDERVEKAEEKINKELSELPNLPHDSVPEGETEEDNVLVKTWGSPRKFDFESLSHWDLGKIINAYDSERASKLAQTRFPLTYNGFARLERALIQFMLDVQVDENGYREVLPPFLVNEQTMYGTGQLPKFRDDLFVCERDDLYLIPTAEVPITNLHRDEILSIDQLPLLYTAYTPCFRREAGSYGKDTRGLIRVHQFSKVELVMFTTPEDSYEKLEKLTKDAEKILELLELPYRRVILCTGDLGFSAAKTYDLEVWMPSYNDYKEVSSCSNFENFQARRMEIRFKRDRDSKPEYVHTLNGSGLAVGRTIASIVENYQTDDRKIEIPEVLRPYMKNKKFIPQE